MITDPEGEQCRSSVIRILHPKMGPVTLADATGDDRCTINATDNARSSRRLTSTASISASCPIIHAVPSISRTATALGTSQQARQRREPQARDFCYASATCESGSAGFSPRLATRQKRIGSFNRDRSRRRCFLRAHRDARETGDALR
jgi:hypothetical protein